MPDDPIEEDIDVPSIDEDGFVRISLPIFEGIMNKIAESEGSVPMFILQAGDLSLRVWESTPESIAKMLIETFEKMATAPCGGEEEAYSSDGSHNCKQGYA